MRGDDYITRTIRQFVEVLAALVKGQAAGETVTFQQLNDLSLDYTGLDLSLLRGLGTGQIIGLFTVAGQVNIEKLYVAATLLHQLAQTEPDGGVKHSLELRVLELLTRVRGEFGDYLNPEHEALVAKLSKAS